METPATYNERIALRIPSDLAERCRTAAQQEERPLSNWVRRVLREATEKPQHSSHAAH